MKISLLLLCVGLGGCISASPEANRTVRIVHDKAAVIGCYLIGTSTNPGSPQGWGYFKEDAFERGGDTVLTHGLTPSEVYACDPAKALELRERKAARAAVRITNRQDVVKECAFAGNVTADSEEDARAKTASAGANVFFVVSDTTRTAMDRPIGSSTTYNYEVRRLTGEAYHCEQPKP